jgi:hypothetical protein
MNYELLVMNYWEFFRIKKEQTIFDCTKLLFEYYFNFGRFVVVFFNGINGSIVLFRVLQFGVLTILKITRFL